MRQRLGGYRHDLLVALRVVNGVEREMVRAEWEAWLRGEAWRCERAKGLLFASESDLPATPGEGEALGLGLNAEGEGKDEEKGKEKKAKEKKKERTEALRKWYAEYCGSCLEEQRKIGERSQSLL